MLVGVGVWAAAGLVMPLFLPVLNRTALFGFPLGDYLAGQGALVLFVVLAFALSSRQDRIDREHGMAEED